TPPAAAASASTGATKVHVIKPGDTYTALAVKYLGHAKYASLIAKANPGKDPNRLYVGAKINIPEPPAGAAVATDTAPGRSTTAERAASRFRKETEIVPPPDPSHAYTVQPGEGWYEVARKFLGDGAQYPRLYELNKERVGGDPRVLPAGTVIELPKDAKLPAKTPPAKPTSAKPASDKPAGTTAQQPK
ncbi:MAG: LysM peptidoglycan-binding domain-containing protein, partial [Planctomycetes bacterium]|nr:LysM peptidoglycan-binding domain-containing protein [Planctomycetota bacterium]